jgi:hypothetical protein
LPNTDNKVKKLVTVFAGWHLHAKQILNHMYGDRSVTPQAICTGTNINPQDVCTATLVTFIGLCTLTAKTRAMLRSLWPQKHYQQMEISLFRPPLAQQRFLTLLPGRQTV